MSSRYARVAQLLYAEFYAVARLHWMAGFSLKYRDKKIRTFSVLKYQKIRTYFNIISGLEQQI